MKYKVVYELEQSGPIDQMEPMPLDRPIMVGEKHVLEFYESVNTAGGNQVFLFPAFEGGEQCWFIREVWNSTPGYSCSGLTNERTVSMSEGVEIMVRRGVFSIEDAPQQ